MAETVDKKEKARDQRLRKTYRWTLDMVNQLAEIQDHKCGVCGRPFSEFKVSPNVDHVHFHVHVSRFDVCSYKPPTAHHAGSYQIFKDNLSFLYYLESILPSNTKWVATVPEIRGVIAFGKTKTEARREAKQLAMPQSVRGLLCPGRHGKAGHGCCNRLLGRVDSPTWLRAAVEYLENPPAKKILDKSPQPVLTSDSEKLND